MGSAASGKLMSVFSVIASHHGNSPKLTPVPEDVSFAYFVDLVRRAQRS